MKERTAQVEGIGQFTGTENYYKNSVFSKIVYTDGVKYLAEKAKAYWLLDVAMSHAIPLLDKEEFMTAELSVNDNNTAVFTLTDGNENVLAKQEIEFTDFPAKEAKFFIQNGVMMLTGEY